MESNPAETGLPPASKRPGRPFALKLLIVDLLFFSWMGWVRFQQALVDWTWLQSLPVAPDPLYLAASGAVWGLLGLAAGLGLWLRRGWSIGLARITAAWIALSYWLERLLLGRAPETQVNLPFALTLTALALFYTFGVLSLPRRRLGFAPRPRRPETQANARQGESQ